MGAPAHVNRHRPQADLHLISNDDIIYEQDILRNPGSIKPWLAYIEAKSQNGSLREQAYVMERACSELPRSYKLWKMYLALRTKHLSKLNPATHSAEYRKVNTLFERALILLNKMPKIWEGFLSFLMEQPLVTYTRRTFDRALRALPITQHSRIWKLYRLFATIAGGETAIIVWRRYLQVRPEDSEEFIDLLVHLQRYTEAVKRYIALLNNPRFRSITGKSDFQVWTEMVDLIVARAKDIDTNEEDGIDVEKVIRSGIEKFADQRGKLWAGLATYWIKRGNFDRARDIFEEAIATVMTVRDFTLVFDSYTEFEESTIGTLMDSTAARSGDNIVDADADEDLDIRMMRFEQLMDRRPFLLNDVLLRQNPNNVTEWEKRVALWGDNKEEVVQTYTNAMAAINPKKAIGKFHLLWANYAKLYEKGGDLPTARTIMDKAVKVPFKSVDELAEMWCEWAEMELRNESFDKAVDIMAKATQAPKRSRVDYFDDALTPQQRVHKSWKLWSFYVDLVESVKPLEETKQIYERIFDLKIATPQTVVNYANLLEENKYYEESYRIYERGLNLFRYPVAFELWNLYLPKAIKRRMDLERLRDLFEAALDDVPPQFAMTLFIMYGKLEEDRGLTRTAMRIYERATRAVGEEDQWEMFNYHITQCATNFGLPATRPIYQRAIEMLPEKDAKKMCLRYAEVERKLGEIGRARNLYGHASQWCDPRTSPSFWAHWEAFEVKHGNEDTFKEMLRFKRSIQAQYKYECTVIPFRHTIANLSENNSTDISFVASEALARSKRIKAGQIVNGRIEPNGEGAERTDAMAALESQARAPVGFVAASTGPEGGSAAQPQEQAPAAPTNPDAINLDEMEE
ncbi:MAG: pre-mRNA-splicing factor syf1 [Peltula sp. TS41687]|nr:MAG: pre-mRNA-splicing factor syf1 [Peltula sp. TS41687]